VPLYEYYCSDCQGTFELLVSYESSEADDVICTRCHGSRVRKLLSVFVRPRAVAAGDAFGDYSDYDASVPDDDFGGSCSCGGGGCGCHD
jgi:putative FmdB family regulatory protein